MIDYEPNKIIKDINGREIVNYIDNFLIYLYNNPDKANFHYDKTSLPCFLVDFYSGIEITQKPVICKSRKLRCTLNTGFNSSSEALDLLFSMVVTELNHFSANKMNYFLSLTPSPEIFDTSFNPIKGMFLRYAELPYTENIMPQMPIEPYANNLSRKQMITPEMDPIEVLMKRIGY